MKVRPRLAFCVVIAFAGCAPDFQGNLPPVPTPAGNPPSEAKRVLGKILFWDEQLSSDDTVACGTCHIPAHGGADPRAGLHPGRKPGTFDDVAGSPGIVSLDPHGRPQEHPVFGFEPQVTPRVSPSNFGALWAPELFWDGRAGGRFVDPVSGVVVLETGGALENQAMSALSNEAEMARSGRTWSDLTGKLAAAVPLQLASDLPPDVAAALTRRGTYPGLFEAAYGTAEINPVRIAFALAAYQRTLVADQTPWDRFVAGDQDALGSREQFGWQQFQAMHCDACHVPPLFTNNRFFNIGVRRSEHDAGRMTVTGLDANAGEFKVPSLRNVGLRPRLMHTGEHGSLAAAIQVYVDSIPSPDRDNIPGFGNYSFNFVTGGQSAIRVFLENGLTDPRVRDETFPFDRPTLGSENGR